IAAFLHAAFWLVDESQGMLRRRNRAIEQVAEEEVASHVQHRGQGVAAAPGSVERDSLHSAVRFGAGSTVDSMRSTTVLFVDDDDFIRGAYGDLLRDEGFSVVEAADGCEALKAATAISGDVLLVLDEEMPCMRGTEVLELIDQRPDAARFQVVIISGS